jgi:type IV pilus assembly protein PilA
MHKYMRGSQRRKAFTLVELMIVVVIVAILALVAIPLYSGNVEAAHFSEGISGVGTIRTALRVFAAANNGDYPTIPAGTTADELSDYGLGIAATDLDGNYFQSADYTVESAAAAYTVTATLNGRTYAVDESGAETGDFTTGAGN